MKKICIALSVVSMAAVALAQVVSFKDAAKIKSWDAWNDHKKPSGWKEKRCVTWAKLNKLDAILKPDLERNPVFFKKKATVEAERNESKGEDENGENH